MINIMGRARITPILFIHKREPMTGILANAADESDLS